MCCPSLAGEDFTCRGLYASYSPYMPQTKLYPVYACSWWPEGHDKRLKGKNASTHLMGFVYSVRLFPKRTFYAKLFYIKMI